MAPKGKKPAGGADKSKYKEDDTATDPLQAVVLADSFETRFAPFTHEKPRCLLPLANTPLIDYTLEFLAHSGVEEVFVYCGAHTAQVEEYLDTSRWSGPTVPFKLTIIRSTSRSIGDAMRDLDKRGTLTGDFIVVYGDVVSNYPLDRALAEHRARRKVDKKAIMTMVLCEGGERHQRQQDQPSKTPSAAPVFVVDPSKQRCLHYEWMPAAGTKHYLEIDPDILSAHQELEVRSNLIDCGIDICTPDVLALWSDNFDYEAPRKGFLYGVLKDYELNGKTIHTHIFNDHYAARVRNLATYDTVSRDIVSRWTFPMTPDSNLGAGHTYRLHKGLVYKEDGLRLDSTSIIGSGTVIGRGSAIGKGSVVVGSTIGRHCRIGNNCTIESAYIWDNAVISDGTQIRNAIIGNYAQIGENCVIKDGALMSFGVKVTSNSVLGKRKRVVRADKSATSTTATSDVSGDAAVDMVVDDEEIESEEAIHGLVYSLPALSLSAESISTLTSDIESEEPIHHERSKGNSFISVASDDSHANQQAADFVLEAAASIYEGLQKRHDSANIQLELTAMRMTANASEHQVRRAVTGALVKRVVEVAGSGTAPKLAAEKVLSPHTVLVERTMFDAERTDKSDQVDFLLLLQAHLVGKEQGEALLLWIIRQLYNMEVLEDEAITQWWADPRSSDKAELAQVRASTQKLVDALEEEDEEESEEEDEEE